MVLSKKMMERGLIFLSEQKKQNGRVDKWEHEFKKATARKYAFDLKGMAKDAGINLDEYIENISDEKVKELYDKLSSVNKGGSEQMKKVEEITKEVSSEAEKEKDLTPLSEEAIEPDEKESESLTAEVSKTATSVKSGREIIKRNVMRSQEVAKMYREEKKKPVEEVVEKKDIVPSPKFDIKYVLIIAAAMVGAFILFKMLKGSSKPVQPARTVVSPSNTSNTGEDLITDESLDTIFSKMGYKLWRP